MSFLERSPPYGSATFRELNVSLKNFISKMGFTAVSWAGRKRRPSRITCLGSLGIVVRARNTSATMDQARERRVQRICRNGMYSSILT